MSSIVSGLGLYGGGMAALISRLCLLGVGMATLMVMGAKMREQNC